MKTGDIVKAMTIGGEDEKSRWVEGALEVKRVKSLGYTQYVVNGFPVDKTSIEPLRKATLDKSFRHRGLLP